MFDASSICILVLFYVFRHSACLIPPSGVMFHPALQLKNKMRWREN